MSRVVRKAASELKVSTPQRRALERAAKLSDREIDQSELPELGDTFFRSAVRNPFYRPVKQQITLRLDADLIAWLRSQGKGYQTKANALLRAQMLKDLANRAS